MDGDGTANWVDADLVPEGIKQAVDLSSIWKSCIEEHGLPLPGTFYTSPMRRCLHTSKLVFSPLVEDAGKSPFRPIVKELLRESLTGHTCDKRSTRSWIAENYPDYVIEEGFSEDDLLFRARWWEPRDEHVVRKQRALEDIWETDPSDMVSLTMHSGAIRAIMRLCEMEEFHVSVGSTLTILVKGERLNLMN